MPGFNVSSLSAYVDQSSRELIQNLVAGANWLDSQNIRVEAGIKAGSTKNLYVPTNTMEFQNSITCSPTASGGTSFAAQALTTTLFTHFDNSYCGNDLAGKYPQMLRAGAQNEVNFNQLILDDMIAQAQNKLGLGFWQSNYNAFSTDFNMNGGGIVYRLRRTTASGSTWSINGVGGSQHIGYAFSAANAVATIQSFAASRPASLYANRVEYRMGPEAFEALKQGQQALNYYNIPVGGDDTEMPIIGVVNGVAKMDFGLAGSKTIIAISRDSIAYGCDLLSDQDQIKVGYNEEFNRYWVRIQIAAGATVLKASEIGVLAWGTEA